MVNLSVGHHKWLICKCLYTKQIGLQPSAVTLFLNTSDSAGILTQDLQNRNLTLYTAKLRSQFGIVDVCRLKW